MGSARARAPAEEAISPSPAKRPPVGDPNRASEFACAAAADQADRRSARAPPPIEEAPRDDQRLAAEKAAPRVALGCSFVCPNAKGHLCPRAEQPLGGCWRGLPRGPAGNDCVDED